MVSTMMKKEEKINIIQNKIFLFKKIQNVLHKLYCAIIPLSVTPDKLVEGPGCVSEIKQNFDLIRSKPH